MYKFSTETRGKSPMRHSSSILAMVVSVFVATLSSEAICFGPNMFKMGKVGQPFVGGPPGYNSQQAYGQNPVRSMFQPKWANMFGGKRWFGGNFGNTNSMTRPAYEANYLTSQAATGYPLNEQLNVAPMTVPSNLNPNAFPITNTITWPPQGGQNYNNPQQQQQQQQQQQSQGYNNYNNYNQGYQQPQQVNQPQYPYQQQQPTYQSQQQQPSGYNNQNYGIKGGGGSNFMGPMTPNYGNNQQQVSTTRRPKY